MDLRMRVSHSGPHSVPQAAKADTRNLVYRTDSIRLLLPTPRSASLDRGQALHAHHFGYMPWYTYDMARKFSVPPTGKGGITVTQGEHPETVLVGVWGEVPVVVTGLRHDADTRTAWEAACKLAEVLDTKTGLLVDAASARVSHAEILIVEEEDEDDGSNDADH